MSAHPSDEDRPVPGRILGRIAARFNVLLLVAAAATLVLGVLYPVHGGFAFEALPGFFPTYGFVSMIVLFVLARGLRRIVARPECYYGERSAECEPQPADQLGIEDDAR